MTRPSDRERLGALDEQIAALQQKKQQLDSKLKHDERKRISRQNIIVGAWIKANRPDVYAEVVAALSRPQDVDSFNQSVN